MIIHSGRGFLTGLSLGIALSLTLGVLTGYVLIALDVISVSVVDTPRLQALTQWVTRNMGLSVIPFVLTFGLYLHSVRALSARLLARRPLDEVARYEHMSDVWTSLFFGIGVIWTAIGMRGALLYALGDPDTATRADAFAVLQRLVDGGILTALTTTIAGGIGGYLMRVGKSFFLGAKLSRYYEEQDQHQSARVERLLQDIRGSVSRMAGEPVVTLIEGNRKK